MLGLWERARIFLSRVGGIILTLMVVLVPRRAIRRRRRAPRDQPIEYSIAGMLGRGLQHIFEPIGFNWQISIALVPGMAAREIAVGALGTVYSLSASGDDVAGALTPIIASTWSLATALSLLGLVRLRASVLSTLAVVKRETNSWRYPLIMAGYLFALGVPRRVRYLPGSCRAGRWQWLPQEAGVEMLLQTLIVAALVAGSAVFATWRAHACSREAACAECA